MKLTRVCRRGPLVDPEEIIGLEEVPGFWGNDGRFEPHRNGGSAMTRIHLSTGVTIHAEAKLQNVVNNLRHGSQLVLDVEDDE